MSVKNLDPNTFGNSRAEISLAKILNEVGNPRLSRHVGRHLTQLDELASNLDHLPNRIKQYLYLLLRADRMYEIDKSPEFSRHPEIKTFLKSATVKKLSRLRMVYGKSTSPKGL